MKKTTACMMSLMAHSMLYAYTIPIELKQDDFVQGKLRQLSEQPLSLAITFPDNSSRQLVHNVFGEQEFMFKSEQTGTAIFTISSHGRNVAHHDFKLKIERHIAVQDQIIKPTQIENAQLAALQQQIQQAPERKTAFIDAFWHKVEKEGTPLIEKLNEQQSRVTFLQRGAKQNVRIWGGLSTHHDFMERFAQSDLWYKSYIVPNDTLVEYRLAPDVPMLPLDGQIQRRALLATAQADPLNKTPYFEKATQNISNTDKFNYYSLLKLPNAPKQPYLTENPQNAKGRIKELIFDNTILANKRRILVYLPANFDAKQSYPALYLFDGIEYLERVPTVTILDNMIAQGVIPPTIAVFIENPSNKSRSIELTANPTFTQILAENLVPFVEKSLALNIRERIISGSSYGGLAAAYTVLTYPTIFNKALILSGSFWWHPQGTASEQSHYIASQFIKSEKLPICFFMSAGRYESDKSTILETSRHLKDVLLAKGYPITYIEQSTAHGYLAWQGLISEGLKYLLNEDGCD